MHQISPFPTTSFSYKTLYRVKKKEVKKKSQLSPPTVFYVVKANGLKILHYTSILLVKQLKQAHPQDVNFLRTTFPDQGVNTFIYL